MSLLALVFVFVLIPIVIPSIGIYQVKLVEVVWVGPMAAIVSVALINGRALSIIGANYGNDRRPRCSIRLLRRLMQLP